MNRITKCRVPGYRSHQPVVAWQHGFNLFEVLIALLVLSFGLLGMAALQNFSLKSTHQSFQRTQATLGISEIIDRMRANRDAVTAGNYNLPAFTNAVPSSPDCGAAPCLSSDLANYDLAQWITKLIDPKNLGASGEVKIEPVGGTPGLFEIGVSWAEGDINMIQTMTVQLP